jgi:outer membrane lipoprotein-sorting protein
MKKWFLLIGLLIIVSLIMILFLFTGTVRAQSIKYGEFSADFVTVDMEKTSVGRIWVKRDRIRQEVTGAEGSLVSIYRFDKMVLWTLMPGNKYVELKNPHDPSLPKKNDFQQLPLGIEVVNGFTCEVFKYAYRNKADGIYTVWLSQKLNYAIKTETRVANNRVIAATECKNIKEEALSDDLFELPPEYQKFLLFKKN